MGDKQSTNSITQRGRGLARLRQKTTAPPTVLAVNCFQHPQPSKKYKSKTVRPNPSESVSPPIRKTDGHRRRSIIRALGYPSSLRMTQNKTTEANKWYNARQWQCQKEMATLARCLKGLKTQDSSGDGEQQNLPHPWPYLKELFEIVGSKKNSWRMRCKLFEPKNHVLLPFKTCRGKLCIIIIMVDLQCVRQLG